MEDCEWSSSEEVSKWVIRGETIAVGGASPVSAQPTPALQVEKQDVWWKARVKHRTDRFFELDENDEDKDLDVGEEGCKRRLVAETASNNSSDPAQTDPKDLESKPCLAIARMPM